MLMKTKHRNWRGVANGSNFTMPQKAHKRAEGLRPHILGAIRDSAPMLPFPLEDLPVFWAHGCVDLHIADGMVHFGLTTEQERFIKMAQRIG